MKGKEHKNVVFCECHSPEHQMIFSFWEDKYEPNMYLTVHLEKSRFWWRVKDAVKHIFGYQCKYGDWDEVCLYKQQAAEIRDTMNLYLEVHDKWQERVAKSKSS